MQLRNLLNEIDPPPFRSSGRVVSVRGAVVLARIPQAAIGDLCYLAERSGRKIPAQVVGFEEDRITLAPFDSAEGLCVGAEVSCEMMRPSVHFSPELKGQVLDAWGRPILQTTACVPTKSVELNIFEPPPNALSREPITEQLITGVNSIDLLLSIGVGQRIGLFASAGLGKSTLLGMIARQAEVDVAVIALVGERGREVKEFIEHNLGGHGMKRSILVVATSDESALRRQMAPYTATAIAEYFRAQGKRVLLMVDSITRTARAIRDVGLASGELPIRQGYTGSVYNELPKLLERAGNNENGSITAIYTVLAHSEGESDSLGDEIKSLLDGHIVLSSRLAEQGIRPAIDITQSVSRLFTMLHDTEYLEVARQAVRMLSRLKRDRDIVLLGGTADKELKAMLELEEDLLSILLQRAEEDGDFKRSSGALKELIGRLSVR